MTGNTVHHFIIEPLKGVGPVRFGVHKDDVSRVFTYVYCSFFKGPDSRVRSDHCEVVGLIIHPQVVESFQHLPGRLPIPQPGQKLSHVPGQA